MMYENTLKSIIPSSGPNINDELNQLKQQLSAKESENERLR